MEDEFGAKDKFSKLEQMVQELLTENLEMKKKEKRFADSFAKLYAALQVKYMYCLHIISVNVFLCGDKKTNYRLKKEKKQVGHDLVV